MAHHFTVKVARRLTSVRLRSKDIYRNILEYTGIYWNVLGYTGLY